MAAPRTWSAGDQVTANGAKGLNPELRDQLNTHRGVASTITTTGTQTALSIPDGRDDLVIFANNASLLTLQGISAGVVDGQRLTIFSIGAGQVDLANQNGSASAANRIINGVTGTISLAAGSGRAMLVYDSTTARWRVDVHQQGDWLTPSYSAGNFTASGSMTWGVDSGDILNYSYFLYGRKLTVRFSIANTDVAGTASSALRVAIPGGFTSAAAAGRTFTPIIYSDAGGTNVVGYADVQDGASVINIVKLDGSNWTLTSSDNTQAIGEIQFGVQ